MLISALFTETAIAAVPKPSYPPVKNEYYPTSNQKFPKAVTNPNAHTREIAFKGAPLDIFTKINMVTQIVLPSAPVLVTIGKPEAFTLEVVPEFNTVFIKPVREVEMTNLIVTTEGDGVYIFILKENPFVPWDVRAQITDPYKQVSAGDTQSMVGMLYNGRRAPEFQFVPMDMRTPNSSAYVYDPLTRMGCSIILKRAIAMPKSGVSAYWLEFKNILPGKNTLPVSSYAISEQSVYTQGLMKVAVPGQRDGSSTPILAKGDKTYMFVFVRNGVLPKVFKFRFALMGAKNLPIDVALPTVTGKSNTMIKGKQTTDEKLQAYYDDLVRKGKIKPQTQEEIERAGTIDNQAQTALPENTGAGDGQHMKTQTTEQQILPQGGVVQSEPVSPQPAQVLGFPEP